MAAFRDDEAALRARENALNRELKQLWATYAEQEALLAQLEERLSLVRQHADRPDDAKRRIVVRKFCLPILVASSVLAVLFGVKLYYSLTQEAPPLKQMPIESRCSRGDAKACVKLGDQHSDTDRGWSFYRSGCKAGYGLACAKMAELLKSDGNQLKKELIERKACKWGVVNTCVELAQRIRGEDPLGAFKLLRRGCNSGDIQSCTSVAVMFDRGEGVEESVGRALGLLKSTCWSGDPRGCELLSQMHREGRGCPQDQAKAINALKQACELGQASACDGLH